MATEIIKEIDSYNSNYFFKIGIIISLFISILFFLFKNINNRDLIHFVANFNYVEGVNTSTEVKLAGIKVGNVNKIVVSSDGVTINGQIEKKYNIPEDSLIKIRSEGIFGKKSLFIEPGFGEYFDKSNKQYKFNYTQDSYSVDMFLRYLNKLND